MSEPRKLSDPDFPNALHGNPWTLVAAIAGAIILILGIIVLGYWATTLGVMLIAVAVLLAGIGWQQRHGERH